MIANVSEAVQEALEKVQGKGYIIIPSEQNAISILWIGKQAPPDISSEVMILETDPDVLGAELTKRTVDVPLWIIMGYPWDYPQKHWRALEKSLRLKTGILRKTRHAYAKSCLPRSPFSSFGLRPHSLAFYRGRGNFDNEIAR